MKRCINCSHSEPNASSAHAVKGLLTCRRFPPNASGGWPSVSESDWCDEFHADQSKNPAEEPTT